MDEVTQQNSALVEENAASAKTLEHQSTAMNEKVAFFQIDQISEHAAKPSAPASSSVVKALPRQSAPARKMAAAGGGRRPVGRGAAATAVAEDSDWKEF
jgi:methyl-accepting chemotaxis protein